MASAGAGSARPKGTRECSCCGGSGVVPDGPGLAKRRCKPCDGRGHLSGTTRVCDGCSGLAKVPDGVGLVTKRCKPCNGSGRLTKGASVCSRCHGQGTVRNKRFSLIHNRCPSCKGKGAKVLRGLDGTDAVLGKSSFAAREKRLNSNTKTLYHQTSPEAAKAILKSGKMLRGSTGLAGGGIYWATTKDDTEHKALSHGVILTGRVRLGRVKTIRPMGDPRITFRKLLSEGYDSVKIPRRGGVEYVVYNSDQVKSVK